MKLEGVEIETFLCLTPFLIINFNFSRFFVIPDEVDIIGYTSNQSDIDDYSSVQSIKSGSTDSGVSFSASRLTLSEIDMY